MVDTIPTIIAAGMLIRMATHHDNGAHDYDDDHEMLICFYIFWVGDTVRQCKCILVSSALADDALLGRKCTKPVILVSVCFYSMSNH